MHQTIAHTMKYVEEGGLMTKSELEAYRMGFEKAKAECIQLVEEWSRACHPTHPKKLKGPGLKNYCWQHHGLQAAKRSIKKEVRLFAVPARP